MYDYFIFSCMTTSNMSNIISILKKILREDHIPGFSELFVIPDILSLTDLPEKIKIAYLNYRHYLLDPDAIGNLTEVELFYKFLLYQYSQDEGKQIFKKWALTVNACIIKHLTVDLDIATEDMLQTCVVLNTTAIKKYTEHPGLKDYVAKLVASAILSPKFDVCAVPIDCYIEVKDSYIGNNDLNRKSIWKNTIEKCMQMMPARSCICDTFAHYLFTGEVDEQQTATDTERLANICDQLVDICKITSC